MGHGGQNNPWMKLMGKKAKVSHLSATFSLSFPRKYLFGPINPHFLLPDNKQESSTRSGRPEQQRLIHRATTAATKTRKSFLFRLISSIRRLTRMAIKLQSFIREGNISSRGTRH